MIFYWSVHLFTFSFDNVNYNKLDAFNDGDPTFTNATDSYWVPNAGIGLYLHSDNYYLGLSTVSLLGLTDDDTQNEGAPYDDYFDQANAIYGTLGTDRKSVV